MEALILLLLAWIGEKTDYEITDIPVPMVIELDAEEITREAYKDTPHLMPASRVDSRVLALYSWDPPETGTVYILNAKDTVGLQAGEDPLENPVFRERLLHELLHHVQYHTGAYDQFPCKDFGEIEAYFLGGKYFQDLQVEDPMPYRYALAHRYSRC